MDQFNTYGPWVDVIELLVTTTDRNGWRLVQRNGGRLGHQELQKRWSELREPQLRQAEARETVMKCKGNGDICQKLH